MKKKKLAKYSASGPLEAELCADKLAFDNLKQANTAKIVADLQHSASLRPYNCRKCGLWHLTSN